MTTKKLTDSNDNWSGTAAADDIDALAGNDTLDGGAGNDRLFGNLGNDLIAGGIGADTLLGGDGDDVLDGGTDNDVLSGDAGNDVGYGGTGNDNLKGGSGNDYLLGGAGGDQVFGGTGSDVINGGTGNDALYDTDSATVYGLVSTEQDEMVGGDGNDSFYGGYDTMLGGDGNDTFNVKNQGTVIGGTGNDTIIVSNTNPALGSWLEGGFGADKITGGSGHDTLFSGYGADTLNGGAGNDSYVITFDDFFDKEGNPGAGIDTVTDTAGLDTVYYIRDFSGTDADGRDDDIGTDGKEFDPAASDIDYGVILPANIENGILDDQIYVTNPSKLTYTVAWMVGNTLNNTLKGSNLNDILDGAGGNDTINAGGGDDVIFLGSGTDTLDGSIGEDTIASTISYNLLNNPAVKNIEAIDLLDVSTAQNATGDNGNNTLSGNSFANILTGNGGNDLLDGWYHETDYFEPTEKITGSDTLIGGLGNDTYRIDEITDLIQEAALPNGGTDTIQFQGLETLDTYTLPGGIENLTVIKNLKQIIGNSLSNRLVGDSSANILQGGYGDDYLDGGTGIDVFFGGYGDDTFVVSDDTEVITEFGGLGQGSDWAQSEKISIDLAKDIWGGGIENGKLTGDDALDLFGSATDNILLGNSGENRLDGQGGHDQLEGGVGNDTYIAYTVTDVLREVTNAVDSKTNVIKDGWIDSIQSHINFSLTSNTATPEYFENLSLYDGSATVAEGNSNANTLLGNSNANTIRGLAGDDQIDGGAGIDDLIGGQGNDTYVLGLETDKVTELSGSGEGDADAFIVVKSVTSLQINIENLVLNSESALVGVGNTSNNVITGNSKDNTLSGLSGNDTLQGKDGSDKLTGGQGADVIDLTESAAKSDWVVVALNDSLASSPSTADRIVKLALADDTLDLGGAIKFNTDVDSVDGTNSVTFKSHSIAKNFIRFDDADSYSGPVILTAANLGDAVEYLKLNITNGSTVAFLGAAPDPTASEKSVASTWIFQDNGATDTLIALVGVTNATSFSTGASFSSTSIHVI